MNFVIFGIENAEVRALGELAEQERRQEGFEQFISDSIYNGELDILAEEIEYDLEETLDRFEELRLVLRELKSKELESELKDIEKWITSILKDLSHINIFDMEDEETITALTQVLIAAFEINRYFLLIEEAVRQKIAEETI